jgi:SpoVK/Ycf46/Vps4 family AAA+-type ATPase
MTSIPPNPPSPIKASSNQGPLATVDGFKDIKWQDPKAATNIPKDTKSKMRARVLKVLESDSFKFLPKVLTVFGIGFSLFNLMQVGEKGLMATIKKMIVPLAAAAASYGFDLSIRPKLVELVETPSLVPKVDLVKDLCWDPKDLDNFQRTLKVFMGDTTSYLSDKDAKQELHGTSRDGLLILAGPPGNGKTAVAYGIGNLAGKPIHSFKIGTSTLDEAFKKAHKKGAILFIDEADAIIRSRKEGATQAFLDTFNRYQGEKPIRVILATNSFGEMDTAIQSRALVCNFSNPSAELKAEIFKRRLADQGLKSSAYESLMNDTTTKDLLVKYDLSGRDLGSVAQDARVIAEMRINKKMTNTAEKDPVKALGQAEVCIKREDLEIALKEFTDNKKKAKDESIGGNKKSMTFSLN